MTKPIDIDDRTAQFVEDNVPKVGCTPFIPISGQSFSCQQDWINRASRVLTRHDKYHNTERNGPAQGWRGEHFTTMCFDQRGRRCRAGRDFQQAEDDGAYPIWWIWPDQICELITGAIAKAEGWT